MGSYGREELYKIGATGLTVTADGAPVAKVAAATLAWDAVPAHDVAERTFKHDDFVDSTEKFLRYGTVICRITSSTTASEVGKFMPYMTGTLSGGNLINTLAAVGGITRVQSLAEGDVFVINESIHQGDRNSDYPVAIDGGRVYKRRLLVVGYGDGTESETGQGREKYAGAAAENAADLAYLNIDACLAASFKLALPQITFVTES